MRDRGCMVWGREIQFRMNCNTHKLIGTKILKVLNKVRQPLQIRQGLSFVLLRCFIEEDSADRQVRVGGISRPVGICLDILANSRNVALSVWGIHIAQKTHIWVSSELWDLTGVIAIRERVRPWAVSWIDYDGKVDLGVGRYPVAFSSCMWWYGLTPERRGIMPVAGCRPG